MIAVGQVAPENVDLFYKLSREIAAELVSTPVSEDELRRAVGPMMQYLARASSGNQFWLLLVNGGAYDPNRLNGARTLVSDYMGITPQTLQATAAKYLRPEKDWTLKVLPKTPAK